MNTSGIPAFNNITNTAPHNQARKTANTPVAELRDIVSVTGAGDPNPTPSSKSINILKMAASGAEKPRIAKVWEMEIEKSVGSVSNLATRDDGIYASSNGTTWKIGFDGKEIWHAKTGAIDLTDAAFDKNGNLFIAGRTTCFAGIPILTSLDPAGNILWNTQSDDISVFRSPLVTNSAIYTTGEENFKCFDLNGTERWSMPLNGPGSDPPFIDDNGKLHIVNFVNYPGSKNITPVHLTVGEKTGSDGKTLEADVEEDDSWETRPLIGSDGTVYGKKDEKFRAVDKDGNEKWTLDLSKDPYAICTQRMGPDGFLYVHADDNTIIKLSTDGKVKWRLEKSDPNEELASDFAWGPDGTFYVTGRCGNNRIYAINPDGTEKWTTKSEQSLRKPIVGPDGTIFTGGSGDEIHAFSPKEGREIFTIPNQGDYKISSFGFTPDGDVITGWSGGRVARYHYIDQEECAKNIAARAAEIPDEPPVKIVNGEKEVDIAGSKLKKRNPNKI